MKKIPQFIAVVHVKVDTLAMKQIDIALSNGLAGAVEAGRGQPIRLRCKPITDTHTHA